MVSLGSDKGAKRTCFGGDLCGVIHLFRAYSGPGSSPSLAFPGALLNAKLWSQPAMITLVLVCLFFTLLSSLSVRARAP